MNEGFYNMRCLVMLITAVCLLILLKYCLFSNMIKIFKTWYMSEIWMPRELPYSWARWIIRDLFQTNFPKKKEQPNMDILALKVFLKFQAFESWFPVWIVPRRKLIDVYRPQLLYYFTFPERGVSETGLKSFRPKHIFDYPCLNFHGNNWQGILTRIALYCKGDRWQNKSWTIYIESFR